MAKQSSRMYGIKVKEHANYYEYGSESDGGFITLYYNSGVWTVKAGKHNQHSASNIKWYRNVSGIGVEYDAGDTIVEFNDGDKVEFMVMEQHTDTTPYVNYMYDIYGNATEKIVNGTKDIFYRITPKPNSQYACKVYQYEDGMIKAEKEVTPEAIRYYKSAYSWLSDNPLLPVFNMLFDWHGTDPESGHLQMSFEAISNSNYIKYNGNFIQKGQTIREWQAVGFSEFKVEDETNKRSSSSLGTDVIPGVSLTKRIGGSKICDTVTKNKQTIFSDIYHDHKEAYYNNHYHKAMYLVYDNPGIDGCWPKKINNDIAITWADPFWFLVTNRAGIEYNGYTYEKHKLIKSWKGTDSVNLVLKKTTSRSVVSSNDSNYVKVIYDILALPDSEYVTVTKQSYFNGDYTDDDSAVIYQSDTPVDFYNIKFTYKASTNKWTIYSKCGYIKYGGRTYPKGRSILSFGTDEYDPEDPHPEIHLEITDETGKYIVEEVKTYYVKTPLSDQTLNYEVHTSSISKTVKVVKSKSGIEEPWVTVNFYDAMYSPYEVDDIAFKYYNSSQSWALYSNNNNLYYNGSNKKKGELLREWAYNEIVTISNISITHDDLDSVEVKVLTKTNGVNYTNKDLDVTIDWFDESDPDFHLAYSYSKNLWVLTAITACYCGGILFTKGQVIKQFQSKVNVDRFMMMFPHTVEGQTEYAEYYVDVIVDNVGGGMTTVNVELPRHHSESFTDKDISRGDDNTVTFTKQDAASLYGYIWQKEEGPPPPPPLPDYNIIIYLFYYTNSYLFRTLRLRYNGSELKVGILLSSSSSRMEVWANDIMQGRIYFISGSSSGMGKYTDNFGDTVTQIVRTSGLSETLNNCLPCKPFYAISSVYSGNTKYWSIVNKNTYLTYDLSWSTNCILIGHRHSINQDGRGQFISDIECGIEFLNPFADLYDYGNLYNVLTATIADIDQSFVGQFFINKETLEIVHENTMDPIMDSLYNEYYIDEGTLYPGQTEQYFTFLRIASDVIDRFDLKTPSGNGRHLNIPLKPFGQYNTNNIRWLRVDGYTDDTYTAQLFYPWYITHYAQRSGFNWNVYERYNRISDEYWAIVVNYKNGTAELIRNTGIRYGSQYDDVKTLNILYYNRYLFNNVYYSCLYDEENEKFKIYKENSLFDWEYVRDVSSQTICRAYRYAENYYTCIIHFKKNSDESSDSNTYVINQSLNQIDVYLDLFTFRQDPNYSYEYYMVTNTRKRTVTYLNTEYICIEIQGRNQSNQIIPLEIFFANPNFETSVSNFAILGSIY